MVLRTTLFGIAALAPSIALAAAAAPQATAFEGPHAFPGYGQPEVTDCRTSGPAERQCVIPAMSAGRYLAEAAGVATATGPDATQSLAISLDGRPCISAPNAKFAGTANLHLVCEMTIIADHPITVSATYAAQNATVEATGPQLVVRRLPWDGILESRGALVRNQPQAPAAAAPAAPAAPPRKPKR
ncbi:MAG TPA: hypothetical protein VG939_02105 [Caulobacteraceae bacterium]|nr:hypothetical protein [Caulobacteraceae bacterium]